MCWNGDSGRSARARDSSPRLAAGIIGTVLREATAVRNAEA